MSRPTIIQATMLGREIHCMSEPEVAAALLALFHPRLVDLHEQKMLHTGPAHHPLFGFPGYYDAELSPVCGTLNVTERMNCRQKHPRLVVTDPETDEKAPVAFPYQGDFLLYVRVGEKIQLINWPVKKKQSDFLQGVIASALNQEQEERKKRRRYLIEEVYYQDIGVPTVPIAGEDICGELTSNLKAAFSRLNRKHNLAPTVRSAIISAFRYATKEAERPCDVIADLVSDGLCTVHQARDTFYQSIWTKELQVDLFSPIVLDAPLRSEEVPVFERYGEWFPGCTPAQQERATH